MDSETRESNFAEWLKQPFSPDMSVVEWFAWVGLLLAALAVWGLIIHRLGDI